MTDSDSFPWHLGVYDAHCHPTDTVTTLSTIPSMKAAGLAIMSTRASDQSLVSYAASSTSASKIVPSFGYHPWFSHLICSGTCCSSSSSSSPEDHKLSHYRAVLTPEPTDSFITSLPSPRPLSEVITELENHLLQHPTALIGEIGLDRGFRLPLPREEMEEKRHLSNHRVDMEHQKSIFTAQLKLAGKHRRAVSVHGVQCHGAVFDCLRELWRGWEITAETKRRRKERWQQLSAEDAEEEEEEERKKWEGELPFPPRVCLHSFSAPLEQLKQYLSPGLGAPSRLFFSFSTTINARAVKGHLGRIEETVKEVPEEGVLVESDLHTAGEMMDEALEKAVRCVCELKGWGLEFGTTRLASNWKSFVFGDGKAP